MQFSCLLSVAEPEINSMTNRLSLSLKKPSNAAESSHCAIDNRSTAVYSPPGISNIANNCYANSIYQCLLNNPSLLQVSRRLSDSHNDLNCTECTTTKGIYI